VVVLALFYAVYDALTDGGLGQPGSTDEMRSIAVLPFENLSTDTEQQYFADGIADELRTQLLSLSDIKVISRSSSAFYQGKDLPLKEIGEALDVVYVLEGSVQRLADEVKIGVQLSNTHTDRLEWSPTPFHEKVEDIFLLQNSIAKTIVSQLSLRLSEEEQSGLDKIPTNNIKAYEAYQKGQAIINGGSGRSDELGDAIRFFEEAAKLDPAFSRAYVGLSDTYLAHIFWGRSAPNAVIDKAMSAAFRALEIDDSLGEIYGALGTINFYRYERETSKNYLNKALALSPGYIGAYERLAWISLFEGDTQQAEKLFMKARELDPLSTKYDGLLGHAYYYSGQLDKGLRHLSDALSKKPGDNFLLWIQGQLQAAAGDYDSAIDSFLRRTVGSADTNWLLGYSYGMAGEREKATEILGYLIERSQSRHVPALFIATIYMGLGEKESALEWLEIDFDEGGQGLFFWGLKNDKRFDPIKNEPRYQELVNKIK